MSSRSLTSVPMDADRLALLDEFGEAVDRCAQLGMFAVGPVDEVAYAEADAERNRLEALLWGGVA